MKLIPAMFDLTIFSVSCNWGDWFVPGRGQGVRLKCCPCGLLVLYILFVSMNTLVEGGVLEPPSGGDGRGRNRKINKERKSHQVLWMVLVAKMECGVRK